MSISIINNTGEPYVVTRLQRSRQHDNPDNVVKIASRTEIEHGETMVLDDYDPETSRFTIAPARETSRARDYRPKLRDDADHKELKR